MINKIFIWLFLGPLLIGAGCSVHEDMSQCPHGVRLSFYYTLHNEAGGDLFAQEVSNISVLVFDENGVYVKVISDQGPQLALGNYSLFIPLDAGKYTFSIWGGDISGFDLVDLSNGGGLRKGVTKMEDLRVMLKGNRTIPQDEEVSMDVTNIKNIFHGFEAAIDVKKQGVTEVQTGLIKSTKRIKVVVLGTEFLGSSELTPYAVTNPLNVVCTSVNGSYKFNYGSDLNSLTIRYLSDSFVNQTNSMTAYTKVLRLTRDGYLNIHASSTLFSEVFEISNAMDLISADTRYPDQQSIDRQEEFEFIFRVNRDHTVTVIVNGWVVIDAEPLV